MGISFLNRPSQTYTSLIGRKSYKEFLNHNFRDLCSQTINDIDFSLTGSPAITYINYIMANKFGLSSSKFCYKYLNLRVHLYTGSEQISLATNGLFWRALIDLTNIFQS